MVKSKIMGGRESVAVCEAKAVKFAKGILDSREHYSRPDCIKIEIQAQNRDHVTFAAGFSPRRLEGRGPEASRRRIQEVAERLALPPAALESAVEEILSAEGCQPQPRAAERASRKEVRRHTVTSLKRPSFCAIIEDLLRQREHERRYSALHKGGKRC